MGNGETNASHEMGGGMVGRGMALQPCPITLLLPLALLSSAPWFFSYGERYQSLPCTSKVKMGEASGGPAG